MSFTGWLENESVLDLPHDVAVGWSGGADSTALLLALKEAGHAVMAWHVDHGWRDSSVHERGLLAARAKGWGIPFYSARLSTEDISNREARARRGRFDQFLAWRRELGVTTLCLAHQRDDQAETVFMRMLQGAGVAGCRGMHRERSYRGLRVVRPFLHVSGAALREGLLQAGVEWFEDPSNNDMSIWRNRIRHEFFPRIAAAGVMPEELFIRWQNQAELLAKRLDTDAGVVLESGNLAETGPVKGSVSLPWRQWVDCSPPVRARVLQRMMGELLGEGVTPGRRHIVMVEKWTGHDGRGGLDLSGCRLQRIRKGLHLISRPAVCPDSITLK